MKLQINTLFLLVALLTLTHNFSARAQGIKFENVSLDEAKNIAKTSGKLIFIDCYTSWCGPCKRMDATTFQDVEVASIINKSFTSIKVDMEKSPDAMHIARKYKVRAYPTLLIIKPDGTIVGSRVGMQNSAMLKAFAKNALQK